MNWEREQITSLKVCSSSNKLNHWGLLIAPECKAHARFGIYVTEIESPYHDIITVSSYTIEISRKQVIIKT